MILDKGKVWFANHVQSKPDDDSEDMYEVVFKEDVEAMLKSQMEEMRAEQAKIESMWAKEVSDWINVVEREKVKQIKIAKEMYMDFHFSVITYDSKKDIYNISGKALLKLKKKFGVDE